MTIKNQIETLSKCLIKLKDKDRKFADSLVHQYWRKGRLSQAQQLWVDKLIDRANEQLELSLKEEPPKSVATFSNLSALQQLFNVAQANGIETPRIRMETPDARRLVISKAHPYSHNQGCIYIRVSDSYYGKIDLEGQLFLARNNDLDLSVHSVLEEIARNPSAVGRVYGRKSGRCMFCGRTLTNHESVHQGYGPVCADKWGLEWNIEGPKTRAVESFAEADHVELSERLLRGL